MKITTDEFIRRSKMTHIGQNLDYSKTIYKTAHDKVIIIDHDINPETGREYGEFVQIAQEHMKGANHPIKAKVIRAANSRLSIDEFIRRAKKVHKGENLDYTRVKYNGMFEKVYIIDHDINPETGKEYGGYWQSPVNILKGHSHPDKAKLKYRESRSMGKEQFIRKAKKVHKDENLDYSKVVYKNMRFKICIIDHDIDPITGKEYGEYWQTPYKHLQGQGHPLKGKTHLKSLERFIFEANKKYPKGNFDYSLVRYINSSEKIQIICHNKDKNGVEHGSFWILPGNFLRNVKFGCPKCAHNRFSIEEKEISEYIKKSSNYNIIENDRKLLDGKEIDIYIPSLSIGIEFDGLFWHSNLAPEHSYDLSVKTELCKNRGIRLLHIFEDEWIYRKEAVKNKLRIVLKGYNEINDIENIHIKREKKSKVRAFLEKYSLTNSYRCSLQFAFYYKERIIAVISSSLRGRTLTIKEIVVDSDFYLKDILKHFCDYIIRQMPDIDRIYIIEDLRWDTKPITQECNISYIKGKKWLIDIDNKKRYEKSKMNYRGFIIDCGYVKYLLKGGSRMLPSSYK